jgi:cold shock CspA family protein
MTIDFGSIKSYNPSPSGFGFVGRTFLNPNGEEVFFHITKIKKKYPELAQKLDNREAFEMVTFWYEIETTEKGERVSKLWINKENIPQSYISELCELTKKIESIWKNLDSPKPSWLDLITIELVGVDRRHELNFERDNLESQLRVAEEDRRREAESLRQKKSIRQSIRLIQKYTLKSRAEADELAQLLAEMRPLNFTRSKELSAYIVEHQLGYNYPNISGIVRMEQAGIRWNFHGGFPPEIYKIICIELNLNNEGTDASPVGFTPFKDT